MHVSACKQMSAFGDLHVHAFLRSSHRYTLVSVSDATSQSHPIHMAKGTNPSFRYHGDKLYPGFIIPAADLAFMMRSLAMSKMNNP